MAAKQRFPWISVSAAVSAVVVGSVTWLQVPPDFVPAHQPGAGDRAGLPVLGLARIEPASPAELLAEQLAAYDPAPMFIPSAMTSSEPELPPELRPGAGGPFPSLPAELTKTGPLKFPPAVPVPAEAADGLRLTERADVPLVMARADENALGPALAPRLAQVEAITAEGGRVALKLDLPAAADFPAGDWQPLELMGTVTRAGLAGELAVATSSGVDEVDAYFRFHLRKNVRMGERLPEGFYVFRVGP